MKILILLSVLIFNAFIADDCRSEVRVNPDKLYDIGIKSFNDGDFKEAYDLIEQAIQAGLSGEKLKDARQKVSKPISERLYNYHVERAMEAFLSGEFQQANSESNKAIEADANYARAYEVRGNSYSRLGLYDASIKDYNKYIELVQPSSFEYLYGHILRGIAFRDNGQYSDAIKDLRLAIDLDPSHKSFYSIFSLVNIGITHLFWGQHTEAETDMKQVFTHVQEQNITDWYTALAIAEYYAVDNDKDNSCKWLRKALEKDNGKLKSHLTLYIKSNKLLNNIRDASCYKTVFKES